MNSGIDKMIAVLQAAKKPGSEKFYKTKIGGIEWFPATATDWEFNSFFYKIIIPGKTRWVPFFTRETLPYAFAYKTNLNPSPVACLRPSVSKEKFYHWTYPPLECLISLDGEDWIPLMREETAPEIIVSTEEV